jgi:hypothetical protein
VERHPRLADLLELCDEQAQVAADIQHLGLIPAIKLHSIVAARLELDVIAEGWSASAHPLLLRYARLHAKRWHFLHAALPVVG